MDIPAAYVDLLQFIQDTTRFSRSMLHVHCGLLIYFATQMVLSDRRASVLGLAWVGFFAMMNEVVEAIHFHDPRWSDTLGDLATTMFWPTVIVLVGRYRRHRWSQRQTGAQAKVVVAPQPVMPRRKLSRTS